MQTPNAEILCTHMKRAATLACSGPDGAICAVASDGPDQLAGGVVVVGSVVTTGAGEVASSTAEAASFTAPSAAVAASEAAS